MSALRSSAGSAENSSNELWRPQMLCSWYYAGQNINRPQSAECCQTQDSNHLPNKEVPAWTATGELDMPVWTWHTLEWAASGVHVKPAASGASDQSHSGILHRLQQTYQVSRISRETPAFWTPSPAHPPHHKNLPHFINKDSFHSIQLQK